MLGQVKAPRRRAGAALLAASCVLLSGCVSTDEFFDNWTGVSSGPAPPPHLAAAAPMTVVLVSIDGLDAGELSAKTTPNLARLAETGSRAERLLAASGDDALVTGRLAGGRGADGPVPIWVSAERAGIRTGVAAWPGAEAPVLGVRPSAVIPSSASLSPEARVDRLLSWLDLPADRAPGFLAIAFQADPATLAGVDAAVGRLAAGLKTRKVKADLVIVSGAASGMGGVLIANGPDIFPGAVLKPCGAADVYGFLARLLDIKPQPNDGRPEHLYAALRR